MMKRTTQMLDNLDFDHLINEFAVSADSPKRGFYMRAL
jgi:hypothetical protein